MGKQELQAVQHCEPYSTPAALNPNFWHCAMQDDASFVWVSQILYGNTGNWLFGSSLEGMLSLANLSALLLRVTRVEIRAY